jgi:ribosomal protein L21E
MLKKTTFDRVDFNIALLEYLNTPLDNVLPSPAELLNNRKLRSCLPCAPTLLAPKIPRNIEQHLKSRQMNQKQYYDKSAKNLPELEVGEKVKVRINNEWHNGTVHGTAGPRSYLIKMRSGRVLRRNRKQLIIDSPHRVDRAHRAIGTYDDINVHSPTAPLHGSRDPDLAQSRSINNTNYVTRFGRTVIPPDRWTYPVPEPRRN